jgi:outer membrane protein
VDYDSSKLRLPEQVELDSEAILGQAYQNRPELKKFEKLQAIAKLQTDMAYAGYKPSIALTASYQGTSIGKNDPGAWGDNTRWLMVLNIKGNFFDGSITPAKVEEAQANQRLVAVNESKLRDEIYLDVEQSIQGLKENLEVIHANQANMNLAEKSLKMTQVKFESGMATTMDVRDSQLALDQALNGYYEGISAYLTALAKLDLAVGKKR